MISITGGMYSFFAVNAFSSFEFYKNKKVRPDNAERTSKSSSALPRRNHFHSIQIHRGKSGRTIWHSTPLEMDKIFDYVASLV